MKKLSALLLMGMCLGMVPVMACPGKTGMKDKGGKSQTYKKSKQGKSQAKKKIGPDAIALKEEAKESKPKSEK